MPAHTMNARRGHRGHRGRRAPRRQRVGDPGQTLGALVAELRDRAAQGEPQDALVDWLYSLACGLGVRMRYDEHTVGEAAPAPGSCPPPDLQENARAKPTPAEEMASKDAFPELAAPRREGPGAEDRGAGDCGAEENPAARPEESEAAREPPKPRKKKAVPVPVSIVRGRMSVDFVDPALLSPRDPPAGGRFAAEESGTVVGRIILSCDRRTAPRVDVPLCRECNGAVIDARAWTHLAIPPRAFAARAPPREVDAHLAGDLYDIVQVGDGTVVTLYRWEHPSKGPIWCMATGNGYDVSHLKWMGDLAYAEVLHELLAAHPDFAAETGMRLVRGHLGEQDVRLDFAALDPAQCYTVGFRHQNFHPMGADPPGVWNIQSADLATGTPRYGSGGLPHIRRQATYTHADIRRLCGRTDSGPATMGDLEQINRAALASAKAAIAEGPPHDYPLAPADGVRVCPFNYGFILRSRDETETQGLSDVLCDSTLLRRVRQLVYQRPSRLARGELDHTTRLEYSALKAFLTVTDRGDFLALFPELGPRYAAYEAFVDNVVHIVLHMHRQNSMAPCSRTEDGVLPRTRTTTMAKAMLTHILRHEKDFKPFQANAKSIVHDFVVQPAYTLLFLRALAPPA